MSDNRLSFVEAIRNGHEYGFKSNGKSILIGEGVNYPNGADGTTKNLCHNYAAQLHDVPISESSFTSLAVGLGTTDYTAIVHHGRVEFALLAMDQILTQAAKWEFMFQNNYSCKVGIRMNIGRQWGNGPQHTSCYSSLFYNTPGLNILWPSRPQEAFEVTNFLHHCKSPVISMEHRYLFKVTEKLNLNSIIKNVDEYPVVKLYGSDNPNIVIITYGDGFFDACRVLDSISNDNQIGIVCLTSFIKDRVIPNEVLNYLTNIDAIIMFETSNYMGGLLQSFLGQIAEKMPLTNDIHIVSPPFSPCPTSPSLVKNYYKNYTDLLKIIDKQNKDIKIHNELTFDEIHLPAEYDFTHIQPFKNIYYDG